MREYRLRHGLSILSEHFITATILMVFIIITTVCQAQEASDYIYKPPLKLNDGWVYNTGSVHLLSGILKNITGLFTNEFAEKVLFEPLGISRYEWNTDSLGHPCTGGTHGGLRLKTRDVAKFGTLYMYDGKWQGNQIIPGDWIQESIQNKVGVSNVFKNRGMGYLWWTGEFIVKGRQIHHFFAAGYGGQTLHIVPELDLMIVLTCWSSSRDADIFGPLLMIYNSALPQKKK
jgi:CubicO group peptidase (beta-lactamase class C family)